MAETGRIRSRSYERWDQHAHQRDINLQNGQNQVHDRAQFRAGCKPLRSRKHQVPHLKLDPLQKSRRRAPAPISPMVGADLRGRAPRNERLAVGPHPPQHRRRGDNRRRGQRQLHRRNRQRRHAIEQRERRRDRCEIGAARRGRAARVRVHVTRASSEPYEQNARRREPDAGNRQPEPLAMQCDDAAAGGHENRRGSGGQSQVLA